MRDLGVVWWFKNKFNSFNGTNMYKIKVQWDKHYMKNASLL
jgi:hypothetical protein